MSHKQTAKRAPIAAAAAVENVDERIARIGQIAQNEREPIDAFERVIAAFYTIVAGDDSPPGLAHDAAALSADDAAYAALMGAKILVFIDRKMVGKATGGPGAAAVLERRSRLADVIAAQITPRVTVRASESATKEVSEKLLLLPHSAQIVLEAMLAGPGGWKNLSGGSPYYGDRSGEHVALGPVGGDPTAVLTAEQQAGLWRVVRALDEESAQLVLFVLGRCLGEGPSLDGNARYIDFHVGESLAFRGYAKHHKGGFRAEHKRAERDRVAALARIWMPVRADVLPGVPDPDESKKTRATKRVRYAPFLTFEIEVEGDVDGGLSALPLFDLPDDARMIPYSFHVALGRWANTILHNSRHLRVAFSAIARYRADRAREDRVALRVGMALTFGWNARGCAQQVLTIRELLGNAKIDRPKAHPRVFREEFERGLQRLMEDGVVADVPGYSWLGEGDVLTGRWFDRWLSSEIVFTAPSEILEYYAAAEARVPLPF